MLGKIIGINNSLIEVMLNVNISETQNLINLFVLLSDGGKNFVGEVVGIQDKKAYINLVGEFVNNNFANTTRDIAKINHLLKLKLI